MTAADGLEPEPDAAIAILNDSIARVRKFTDALAREGEVRGLIGPLELPRLWSRHVLNCALVAPLLKPGRVADVGSGAGLPGVVLAIMRPDAEIVLIEPMERRVEWLQEQIDLLELTNATVFRARAEDLPHSQKFDQVTARAVSALKTLIPMTARLVRPGGELVFLKGARVDDEVVAAKSMINRAKLSNVEILTLGGEFPVDVTRVFRATVD